MFQQPARTSTRRTWMAQFTGILLLSAAVGCDQKSDAPSADTSVVQSDTTGAADTALALGCDLIPTVPTPVLSKFTRDILDPAAVSWNQIERLLRKSTFNRCGSQARKLPSASGPVMISIFPERRVQILSPEDLAQGVVIARIESDGDYANGITEGLNWLYVDVRNGAYRGIILSESNEGRTAIPDFLFTAHSLDENRTVPIAECLKTDAKACWVDSEAKMLDPTSRGPSQPWVACTQYGCCCGGTKCHGNKSDRPASVADSSSAPSSET
jgi:hypothetical protein